MSNNTPKPTDYEDTARLPPASPAPSSIRREAVRQLRGDAHPAVQVPGCALALAQGTEGWLGTRHGSATLVLERAA